MNARWYKYLSTIFQINSSTSMIMTAYEFYFSSYLCQNKCIEILRKQVFFFDINKIVIPLSEILWGARYMSNELIFQISASWLIGNITARSETDFEESPF